MNKKVENQDVLNDVVGVIRDKLSVPAEQNITMETALSGTEAGSLKADSLDAVELVMELETKYSITIADEEAQKFKTVGDIVSFVTSKS